MREAYISVEHVSKSFKDLEVLKDVDFKVKEGSVFTLLGENGSGKTTLIHMMVTLLDMTSGKITIDGLNVKQHPEKVREMISLAAQSVMVDETMSGYANLKMIATLRKCKDANSQIQTLVKRFGLESFYQRKVATYSGGMKRRLDLAMTMIGDPKIIFLDEPTTGVDPKSRNEIWNLILHMKERGTTIFLTTQYLEEADVLSDEIAFLHQGRIVLQGNPAKLKKQVNHKWCFGFASEKEQEQAIEILGKASIDVNVVDDHIETTYEDGRKAIALLSDMKGLMYYRPLETTLNDIFLSII